MKVRDTESFIEKSRIVHGDKYDYSLVNYTKSVNKVKIICPIHGVFEQVAVEHARGYGCFKCSSRARGYRDYSIDGKRRCARCGDYFELDYFYPNKKVSDGLDSWCKGCSLKSSAEWKENNIDHVMQWRKTYCKNKWAKYKEDNKEELERKAKERELKAIENKRSDRIWRTLKSRLRDAFIRESDTPHVRDVLGCSVKEFERYIESLWTEGMSWENQGYYGWHFDHIIPCAAFDPNDIEGIKKCFHYTNYQPMWRADNQKKQAKYNGVDYKKERNKK